MKNSFSTKVVFALALAASISTYSVGVQAAPKKPATPAATAAEKQQALEKSNKAMVLKFYDEFFNKHRISAADDYLDPNYIQHNPFAATGREAVKKFFVDRFKQAPQSRALVKRSLADGDLVAVHVHSKATPDDLGRAVVDIFRVKNGKIVEHWDAVQPVPAKSANNNTMF